MSFSLEPTVIPKANALYTSYPLGGEILVHDTDNRLIYSLNETSNRIYQLCDGCRSHVEIAKIVCEDFPSMDNNVVKIDVERILAEMLEKGILVLV